MALETRTTDAARRDYLRRVAIVFAADIRIKIVSELYQREMSAKQFLDEFGGGSITRVDRHFKRLAEHGWLRYVRSEGPDSRRRGSREHFYRAPQLAILDNETWRLVPYSVRIATSWRTFMTLAERVREALDAGTLDARDDSHLSYTTMNLDELGWERIAGAIDSYFESIFEEQADARLRISHTGERPMIATIALVFFESPQRPPVMPANRGTPNLVPRPSEPLTPFQQRLSKVFEDTTTLRILAEANLREVSVPMLSAAFPAEDIQVIRRRVKSLERDGWLSQVNEKTGGRRRSAIERFYKATAPAMFDNDSWAAVSPSAKSTYSWSIFRLLGDLVREAIAEGTFESRLDSHLSWTTLRFDQLGWENVAGAMDELLTCVLKEQRQAQKRLESSGASSITATVGLGAFESPKTAVREP